MKKILIVGPQGSGKTTFAQMIHELTGCIYTDATDTLIWKACQNYRHVFERHGFLGRPFTADVVADKDRYRAVLVDVLAEINATDELAFIRDILAGSDIYTGLRCEKTLKAAKEARLFDYIIYISKESDFEDMYNSIEFHHEDNHVTHLVQNDGTLGELFLKAAELVVAEELPLQAIDKHNQQR